MGYFDYLDNDDKSSKISLKEHHNFDPIVKMGLWVWLGSLFVSLVTFVLMLVCWPLGKSIVLDVFLVLGFGSAVVSVAFCVNARRIASKKRQETQLGNCIFIWGIFLALVNLIILVINTYMVFT